MSILIKGMDMPRSCHSCCFFGQADIWESDFDGYTKSFCERTGSQTFDYVDKFLPNCPLIPVPPHGDLIERDEAVRDLRMDYAYAAARIVSLQPVIIPAEPPKEEA